MRAFLVVPLEPLPNDPSRLLKCLERMLPHTFLLETPKEPLDDPVLFGRIGRDELLLELIVATGLTEPTTLKDEAIVAAEDWRPHRTQRPEALQTRRFDRPFCLLRSTTERKLVPDHFPIMTVDHRREMRPAILPTRNMCHIHGPAFVAVIRPTRPALHARAWGADALMHEPPFLVQDTVDRLPIDLKAISESQLHPQPAIAKRRMLLNPIPQPLQPRRLRAASARSRGSVQTGSADPEYLAAPSLGDTRQRRSHASDVFRSKG